MTSPTPAGPTEALLIDWQLTALDDLRAFIVEHSQGAAAPLPAVTWSVSELGDVDGSVDEYARDPSGIRADRRNVVQAYAEALGTEVEEIHAAVVDSVRYRTRGRIGPVLSLGKGRTRIAVSVDVQVTVGAGSPETSALTHCPTCGSPEWLDDGRRGWNPVDVECEVCAGTYTEEADDSQTGDA